MYHLAARTSFPSPSDSVTLRPSLVFLTLLATPAFAQSADSVALDGPWRFRAGDAAAWSQPALDDGAWRTLDVPDVWESGLGDYDGFGWYRREVRAAGRPARRARGHSLRHGGRRVRGVLERGEGGRPRAHAAALRGGRGAAPVLHPRLRAGPGGGRAARGGRARLQRLRLRRADDARAGGALRRLAARRSPRPVVIGGPGVVLPGHRHLPPGVLDAPPRSAREPAVRGRCASASPSTAPPTPRRCSRR